MYRVSLMGSAALAVCLAAGFAAHAATPDTLAPANEAANAAKPAALCLSDADALSATMQKEGYWLGGGAYGYGYPVGDYGYGYGSPIGGYPAGSEVGYRNTRPGYEIRNLLTSATILAQYGQQQACEAVLDTARTLYKTYASDLHRSGWAMADGRGWQKQQIAASVQVTDKTALPPSGQLIDTDVRNAADDALGSVHDMIMNPKTGKIAYLIIGRGGLFGIDEKFVPVPWDDFKLTQNLNILVLDTSKTTMQAAPQVSASQFITGDQFAEHSSQVDAFWKAHPPLKASD